MKIAPPAANEDFGFYQHHIARVVQPELIQALTEVHANTRTLILSMPDEAFDFRYADGKWTVKEVLAHLIDAERNFCYRAMRFSRGDKSVIPAWDMHNYALNSNANNRNIHDIMDEFDIIRKATIAFFKSLSPEMLDLLGPARDIEISPRAIGFTIAGHEMHHVGMIQNTYLPAYNALADNSQAIS